MKTHPAFALIELHNIATGIKTADALLKVAPVAILKTGTVHNGKYLILIGGSVAAVEEAYDRALLSGGDQITDTLLLPDIHPEVYAAVLGKRFNSAADTLGVVETDTAAAIIRAADAAVKGANIRVLEVRLADDLGGKGLALYCGKIEEVEIALSLSLNVHGQQEGCVRTSLIPNLHGELVRQLQQSSVFKGNPVTELKDGEV
jgi:microcompartment protein CcmL/EutN